MRSLWAAALLAILVMPVASASAPFDAVESGIATARTAYGPVYDTANVTLLPATAAVRAIVHPACSSVAPDGEGGPLSPACRAAEAVESLFQPLPPGVGHDDVLGVFAIATNADHNARDFVHGSGGTSDVSPPTAHK